MRTGRSTEERPGGIDWSRSSCKSPSGHPVSWVLVQLCLQSTTLAHPYQLSFPPLHSLNVAVALIWQIIWVVLISVGVCVYQEYLPVRTAV